MLLSAFSDILMVLVILALCCYPPLRLHCMVIQMLTRLTILMIAHPRVPMSCFLVLILFLGTPMDSE